MEPFKNEFSYEKACHIAGCLRRVHPAFSLARFRKGLHEALEPLELKDRMRMIADRIEAGLPEDPRVMFPILVSSLAVDEKDRHGLRGFAVWPLTELVARRGLRHFRESMRALEQMTSRFTGEFAIRPFLRVHPERTIRQLHTWCGHSNEHVRRLVSEGSRPLLPWGGKLPEYLEPPFPTIGLLEKLHADSSAYVRLSVANHLNDFSKHHPRLVLDTLERWGRVGAGDPQFDKLARHACRTLLKAGHPDAMEFHGFGGARSLDVQMVALDRRVVSLGESLGYRLVVRNRSREPVRVLFDYAIHHRKANGGTSPKVFKGRIRELAAGAIWEIDGRHPFRQITTRTYYPGTHRFEPIFNGKAFHSLDFQLRCEGV